MKTIGMELWDVDISKISAISKIKSSGTINESWYFFTVIVRDKEINSNVWTDKQEAEKTRETLLMCWRDIK